MARCLYEGTHHSPRIVLYLISVSQPYPGYFYTGDGAVRDKDGYIWIKGRVDGM